MFGKPLAHLRFAGRLCSFGAWLVLAIGLAGSICLFFITYTPDPSDPGLRSLLSSLVFAGFLAMLTFFFFLCLFAIGAFLRYTNTKSSETQQYTPERSELDIEITPLPR